MYNNGNSSKNVTGSSVVDGTLENADFADDTISGNKIDGGTISNFSTPVINQKGIIFRAVGKGSGTDWLTIFTRGNSNVRSVCLLDVYSMWSTGNGGHSQVLLYGDGTIVATETNDAHTGTFSYQWVGDDFQVSNSSASNKFVIEATLTECYGGAYTWQHTWSTMMS
jgi:hypothetical protein